MDAGSCVPQGRIYHVIRLWFLVQNVLPLGENRGEKNDPIKSNLQKKVVFCTISVGRICAFFFPHYFYSCGCASERMKGKY